MKENALRFEQTHGGNPGSKARNWRAPAWAPASWLVQKPRTAELLKTLEAQGIRSEVFRPIAGACSLTMG